MSLSVADNLSLLKANLERLERQVTQLLQNGATDQVISDFFILNGLDAPLDIVDLYSCNDGVRYSTNDIIDDICLFPGFYWLSLKSAFTVYNAISSDERWDKSWVPIFSNGGGDFYAVICDKKSIYFGGIVGFIMGEEEHFVEYSGINNMLACINACYSGGVFFLKKGRLDANYFDAALVAKSFNQSLPYYN